jgi:hypothetical protein
MLLSLVLVLLLLLFLLRVAEVDCLDLETVTQYAPRVTTQRRNHPAPQVCAPCPDHSRFVVTCTLRDAPTSCVCRSVQANRKDWGTTPGIMSHTVTSRAKIRAHVRVIMPSLFLPRLVLDSSWCGCRCRCRCRRCCCLSAACPRTNAPTHVGRIHHAEQRRCTAPCGASFRVSPQVSR